MNGLRLQLLGGFLCDSSEAPVELPFGMQRLVAYLAVRGPARRITVAGLLWPDAPESQALASLRTTVWRVNKLVPGLLETHGTGLRVSSDTWVDSQAQERLATRVLTLPEPTTELDMLCRPELLPGWYDDWVVLERERLSQLRLHALEVSARRLTRDGDLDAALPLALEAVRAEPLRETANAVLIAVYLAEGNVCDAIHQYAVFKDLLHRELGLEPSERLKQTLNECSAGAFSERPGQSIPEYH